MVTQKMGILTMYQGKLLMVISLPNIWIQMVFRLWEQIKSVIMVEYITTKSVRLSPQLVAVVRPDSMSPELR